MEQQHNQPPAAEVYTDEDELVFVSETLAIAAEKMADRYKFDLDDVEGTYGDWGHESRRVEKGARHNYKMTLNDEREQDVDEFGFLQYQGDFATVEYVLEHDVKNDFLFANLTSAEQAALVFEIERKKRFAERYQQSETYQALLATVNSQTTYPINCRQRKRTRYYCSEQDSQLNARDELNRITIDGPDLQMRVDIVDALHEYGRKKIVGHDTVRTVTVDDPSTIEDKPKKLKQASDADMKGMRKILYFLGLPGGEVQEQDEFIGEELFDRLDKELYIDLSMMRESYIDACQPTLNKMNELKREVPASDVTPELQAQMDTLGLDLTRAIRAQNILHRGQYPNPGDMITIGGDQMLHDLDPQSEDAGFLMAYRSMIDGTFERIDVHARMNDDYLQLDPNFITPDELYELYEPYGIGIVMSGVTATNLDGEIQQIDNEVFVPLQRRGSVMHMYNTKSE